TWTMPRSLWTTTPLAPASWCSVKNAEMAASYFEKSSPDASTPLPPFAGAVPLLLQAIAEEPRATEKARRAHKETLVSRCIQPPYYILPCARGSLHENPPSRGAREGRRCRRAIVATPRGS